MSGPIVVDTMIASAWLGKRQSQRRARWAPLLESSVWVLPFVVVAEMRFGAEVAAWGARRRGALDRLVDRAGVVPPLRTVTDASANIWMARNHSGSGPSALSPGVGDAAVACFNASAGTSVGHGVPEVVGEGVGDREMAG